MTKWETARYLIDAKKCIDSLMFIDENSIKLSNLNLREIITSLLQQFYISCCVVLDQAFPNKGKKKICQENKRINSIYYERDKDKAHKDKNYQPQKYATHSELIEILTAQIEEVRKVCASILPDNITLDYVPHDARLFRFVHSILPEKEEAINNAKYPWYISLPQKNAEILPFKLLEDTEDARYMGEDERKKLGVRLVDGINQYEAVQNRQDFCIKINVLYNQDCWCTVNHYYFDRIKKLQDVGYIDKCNVPRLPNGADSPTIQDIINIINILHSED